MTRAMVPIASLQRRIPTAGRIRIGEKVGAKGAPKALGTFRLTSHDEEAVEQVASIYGGTARAWNGAPTPGQFEVITEATELRIVLPPDPLSGTPVYEQWSGGGCQRRCDGVTCTVTQATGPDTVEPVEIDCICAGKGEMECAVKTRLNVILPDIKFAGVWRLESGSWNVAQEMPGMVDMIEQLLGAGKLPYALLGLEHRKSVAGGKTRRFIVPALRLPGSMEQLARGELSAGAMAQVSSPDRLALASGGGLDPDDDVVDGEIVEADPGVLLAEWTEALDALDDDTRRDVVATFHEQNPGIPFDQLADDNAKAWIAYAKEAAS
jgi:hypothetical protein